MRRTLSLSLIVAGAAVALAVGSYSVLANAGPVVNVGGTVAGADDPDDGVVEVDDGDTDVENGDGVTGEDGSDRGDGAQDVAQAIADSFGVSQEDVLALHEDGIGFGALFKLYVLAAAGGTSFEDLLSTIPADGDGGYEFAFGKLFKEMADEVSALSADGDVMPKNLGQVVSGATKGDDGASVAAVGGGDDGGDGPPDHAKAHGRN